MEYRKDVDVMTIWFNELVPYAEGWTEEAQFALVDVLLKEFRFNGVDGIRMGNTYYTAGLAGTNPLPRYDNGAFGLTKRPEEIAYVVNEAHRLGMTVLLGNAFYPQEGDRAYELIDARPAPLGEFYDNVERLNLGSLVQWTSLGVDMAEIGSGLESPYSYPDTYAEAAFVNDRITAMALDARSVYPGPVVHYGNAHGTLYPGRTMLDAPLWEAFDVIGAGLGAFELSTSQSATVGQLTAGWRRVIRETFAPFQTRYGKPFLALENGCFAVKGCASKWGSYCSLLPGYDPSRSSLADIRSYYMAQDAAFREMEGYFGPGWHYYSFNPYYAGSVRDTGVNPRMKVEDLIQLAFLGETRSRIITVDADLRDWQDTPPQFSDPRGDSSGSDDLVALTFAQDTDYLYLRVDYTAPPNGFLSIELDTNGDHKLDSFVLLNNRYDLPPVFGPLLKLV